MRRPKAERAAIILHALSLRMRELEFKRQSLTFTEYHVKRARISNREDKIKFALIKTF